MGVMIKGFEMPKNCLGCSTKCDPENRKCNIDGHVFEETFTVVTSRRDKDCPLVETDNEPITKNDLPHCQHTDEEIAKSFIEDVEAVKDQLPCGERMGFPSTFDEFAKNYGFRDKEEIYTNGSELIPVFRVKQWLEHISTTKNDLEVLDKIRAEIDEVYEKLDGYDPHSLDSFAERIDFILDKYKKEGEQK